MDFRDCLLVRSKVAVAVDDKMRKGFGKVVLLTPSDAVSWRWLCHAMDERDLGQIVQDTGYVLMGCGVCLNLLPIVEIN